MTTTPINLLYKCWLYVRATVFYMVLISWMIPALILFIVSRLLPIQARHTIIRSCCMVSIFLARIICGLKIKVIGQENITETPTVIFAKHQSAWETMAIPTLFHHPLTYILKQELLKIPLLGWAILAANPIAIDRKSGEVARNKVNQMGIERMKQGYSVVIYPEGTRTPPYEHPPFKKGGIHLAKNSGFPILPIAVNSGRLWPRNTFIKYPGLITISIGPAIDSTDKTLDELYDASYNWVKEEMIKLEKKA